MTPIARRNILGRASVGTPSAARAKSTRSASRGSSTGFDDSGRTTTVAPTGRACSASRILEEQFAKVTGGHPLLLAVTFRPEFTPPWLGRPYVEHVRLDRLPRGGSAEMNFNHAFRGRWTGPSRVEGPLATPLPQKWQRPGMEGARPSLDGGRPWPEGIRAPLEGGRSSTAGIQTRFGGVQPALEGVDPTESGAPVGIAVGNVAPVTGVMAPLLVERVVAVPLSVPVKQGQSLTVDLDMPRAKVQYTPSPERRDDRAADPTAPADSGASEHGEKRRIIGVGPRTVGE